jgi:hypothetical protein
MLLIINNIIIYIFEFLPKRDACDSNMPYREGGLGPYLKCVRRARSKGDKDSTSRQGCKWVPMFVSKVSYLFKLHVPERCLDGYLPAICQLRRCGGCTCRTFAKDGYEAETMSKRL